MQVAIRRKLREGGMCNLDLWKLDWDSLAVLPLPSLDKLGLGEGQNKKPGEVTKKGEKSKEAVEEDIATNSIREGPQSSANMSLPNPLSQPPSFSYNVVLGEDQNKKPDEVTKKDEKSKEAEEEDISTNSIMEGPQSSSNMSLPTPLSQPPSFSPKHQPHASILSQPRVPQPQSSHHHPSSSKSFGDHGKTHHLPRQVKRSSVFPPFCLLTLKED